MFSHRYIANNNNSYNDNNSIVSLYFLLNYKKLQLDNVNFLNDI